MGLPTGIRIGAQYLSGLTNEIYIHLLVSNIFRPLIDLPTTTIMIMMTTAALALTHLLFTPSGSNFIYSKAGDLQVFIHYKHAHYILVKQLGLGQSYDDVGVSGMGGDLKPT